MLVIALKVLSALELRIIKTFGRSGRPRRAALTMATSILGWGKCLIPFNLAGPPINTLPYQARLPMPSG